MFFYPLKFKPIYKEKIWGGTKLKDVFKRKLPANKIGESWEIAAHPNGNSVVINGPLKGEALSTLIEKYPEILGKERHLLKTSQFPLLVKILDASDKLSVQVHPDNKYASKYEGEYGKTEMWYIIDAEPGAKLIYGLKPGTTKTMLAQSINEGNIEEFLNEVEVKKGDVFFIPSGTIHAIKEGILLAEIQQNSDSTYRVYDWNRKDQKGKSRPLHVKKALNVIKFDTEYSKPKSLKVKNNNYNRTILTICPYFAIEKIKAIKKYKLKTNNTFFIILPLKGNGKLHHRTEIYTLEPGETTLIPANIKEINITGNLEFLLVYLPGKKKEVLSKLQHLGFSLEEIENLAGIKDWENLIDI